MSDHSFLLNSMKLYATQSEGFIKLARKMGMTYMKKLSFFIIPALCLTGYVANAQTVMQPPMEAPPGYAPPPQAVMAAPPQVVVAQPYCQPYSDSFTMGGEKRITRGTACLHPDGSWELHPTQAAVNYVTRGGAIFIVPSQPFATVVVENGHPHHRHDFDR